MTRLTKLFKPAGDKYHTQPVLYTSHNKGNSLKAVESTKHNADTATKVS